MEPPRKSGGPGASVRWTRGATIASIIYVFLTAAILFASIHSVIQGRRAVHAAIRAADAATDQAKIAEDTEKRQLRPYVFINTTTMRDFVVGEKPNAKMEVKNTGQTPGFDVVFDLGITLRNFSHLGSFDDPGHPSPPTPIGPSVSLWPIGTATDPLDETIIAAIKNGNAAYFVFGTITYKDAFGKDHWTKIRWIFGAAELADGSGAMSIYREGNDADR
jgi:hypothetical protein